MAKQKDYLADILGHDEYAEPTDSGRASRVKNADRSSISNKAPSDERHGGAVVGPGSSADAAFGTSARRAGSSLLARESALARVAKGEVRQVTQLLLDPSRVRIWPGNARAYERLSEENCRELIDSILAEGGQKVPAIVRRLTGQGPFDYEVIAGTRRHFSISWLRTNSYPDMQFLAEVHDLDDEAAFRLADVENRARKDVSDLERARNYAAALTTHYAGHMTRMADRLNISKGWLSKMLKVAALPDQVVEAFASPADIKLKPAYPLSQACSDKDRGPFVVGEAARITKEQKALRDAGKSPLPAATVLARLLAAGEEEENVGERYVVQSRHGHPALSIMSQNRQGITIRLHAGSGATDAELAAALKDALAHLKSAGSPLPQ